MQTHLTDKLCDDIVDLFVIDESGLAEDERVGSLPSVIGPGSLEAPAAGLTRDELLLLRTHWIEVIHKHDSKRWLDNRPTRHRDDIQERLELFARRRLARITPLCVASSDVLTQGETEVCAFTPIRHEVFQLVQHWFYTALHHGFGCWVHRNDGLVCRPEEALAAFTRADELAQSIGNEQRTVASSAAEAEYRKGTFPSLLDTFLKGDAEERDRLLALDPPGPPESWKKIRFPENQPPLQPAEEPGRGPAMAEDNDAPPF